MFSKKFLPGIRRQKIIRDTTPVPVITSDKLKPIRSSFFITFDKERGVFVIIS